MEFLKAVRKEPALAGVVSQKLIPAGLPAHIKEAIAIADPACIVEMSMESDAASQCTHMTIKYMIPHFKLISNAP